MSVAAKEASGRMVFDLSLIKRSRQPFLILEVLLLLMPFHEYVCELFLASSRIDNLWRDVLLLIGILMIGFGPGIHRDKTGAVIFISTGVFFAFAVVSYFLYGYEATFNVFRTYVIPTLVFFLVKETTVSSKRWKKLFRLLFLEFSLMGYYCFIQAFFLGTRFALKLGYGTDGVLGHQFYIAGFYGRLRAFGTFVYPNICGIVLAMVLCLYLFSDYRKTDSIIKQFFNILGMSIGLLSTFSRSAILGLMISSLYFFAVRKKKKISKKAIIYCSLALFGGCIAFILIDRVALKGMFTNMIFSYLQRTVKGGDTSAAKHIEDIFSPIITAIKNPLGLGFGGNGSMALANSKDPNLVESSLWLMCYEVGFLFAILYFYPYINLLVRQRKEKSSLCMACKCAIIAVVFTFLVLPNIQSFEVIFYSFFIIGLSKNRNVKYIL